MWSSYYKFHFQLFCIIMSVSCENISSLMKIVGGRIVSNQTEFPFIVSVRVNGRHICGGSIIDYRHVLTAAHCCFNSLNKPHPPQILSIAAGDLNITIRYADNSAVVKRVEKLIINGGYDPDGVVNDIALIRISGELPRWSNSIRPILLSNGVPKSGNCTVCGWGIIKFNTTRLSTQLRAAQISIVPNSKCREYCGKHITRRMLCAGGNGVDSCQGDSGGPLIYQNSLAGIVSWGSGCAVYPGVYTAVSEYKSWIRKHVNSSSLLTADITIRLLLILLCTFVTETSLYL